jgi:hypothetical protein
MLLIICVRPVCAGEVFAAPLDKDFGDVLVDGSSEPVEFGIYNIGVRDLKITHLSLSDNINYSLRLISSENGCESDSPTIAAGKNCEVAITFHPVSVGVKKAVFQVTGGDLDGRPLEADLQGRGVTSDDNEGDGLPDIWEQQIVDADPNDQIRTIEDVDPNDDFDGDGKTNSQEFIDGTNPINNTANTPELILHAQAESDREDAGIAPRPISMEAGLNIGEELLLDLISDIYLNSLQVPVFMLNFGQKYLWPASFADSVGLISARLTDPM